MNKPCGSLFETKNNQTLRFTPPSAKLLLLLELSDLGGSRSILVNFMEVVSMKKLLLSLVLLSSVGLAQAQTSGVISEFEIAGCEFTGGTWNDGECLQPMKPAMKPAWHDPAL